MGNGQGPGGFLEWKNPANDTGMKVMLNQASPCRPWQWRFTLIIVPMGLAAAGCGTVKGGRGWGQDAFYPLSWERVRQAATKAVLDPTTWIPAAGAAVFTIDNWDEKTSSWAARRTPVFGSQNSADNASRTLLDAMYYETIATAVATPSGNDPFDWSLAKARGLALEYGASRANEFVTGEIKDAAGRERPDQSDKQSFPSGGASAAFTRARLSNRNLDAINMPGWARTTLKAGTTATAASVGWARVEARKHFPSDVLAGACLGNLLTTFIHDAFMNLPDDSRVGFYLEPSPSGVSLAVSLAF